MHSIYARVNNVSAFLSTCLMALLGAVALSSLLFTADPKGTVSISSIDVHPAKSRLSRSMKQDFAFVNFNVTADLQPLFHWNTKQLFVYLVAEYNTTDGVSNEVVIWDRIVRKKSAARMRLATKQKYSIRDLSGSFKSAPEAHFALKYNVMPWVGALSYGEAARTSEPVPFPASKPLVT